MRARAARGRAPAALAGRAAAGPAHPRLRRRAARSADARGRARAGRSGAGCARARPRGAPTGSRPASSSPSTRTSPSLGRPGAYDPAELIRSALNALRRRPGAAAAERARRRHIFVDEYQDTDPAQAELLALLADGRRRADPGRRSRSVDLRLPRRRRVGDPRRRRALRRREVPGRRAAGVAPLRAGAAGRVAAGRRAAARPGRARRLASAARRAAGAVEVGLFRTASEEAAYLAGVLRRAHLDGMAWSRMAVLVRSTAAVLGTLRRALITAGVPVAVRGEDLPLAEQPAVAVLLEVLRVRARVDDALTEDVAERLLLGPIGARRRRLPAPAAAGAAKACAGPDEPVLLAPALLDPLGAARAARARPRARCVRVAAVLAAGRAAVAADGDARGRAVGGLGRHRAGAALAAGERRRRRRRRGRRPRPRRGGAAVRRRRPLHRPAARASRCAGSPTTWPRSRSPATRWPPAAREPEAVTILTAHASKGLEWDLVCVAHVQEGSWPDLRRRGSLLGSEQLVDVVAGRDTPCGRAPAPQLAEERRLFYVAATRARQRLVVTAVSRRRGAAVAVPRRARPDRGRASARRGPARHAPDRAGRRAARRRLRPGGRPPPTARPPPASWPGWPQAGVRGADPDQWWGLAPVVRRRAAGRSRPAGAGQPVAHRLVPALRAALAAAGPRRARRRPDLGVARHARARGRGRRRRPTPTQARARGDARRAVGRPRLRRALVRRNERERASRILAVLLRWLRASRAEASSSSAIEEKFQRRSSATPC